MGKMFGYELHVAYKDPTYGNIDEYLPYNTPLEASKKVDSLRKSGVKLKIAELLSIEESYITDQELKEM